MKRQQETVGSIVQIHVNDEFYVYAQILPHGLLAFFDYKSDTELSDLNVLKNAKVLFITAVYKYVITKGIWLKVGKIPIREDLQILPLRFVYDRISEKFFTYNPEQGRNANQENHGERRFDRGFLGFEVPLNLIRVYLPLNINCIYVIFGQKSY